MRAALAVLVLLAVVAGVLWFGGDPAAPAPAPPGPAAVATTSMPAAGDTAAAPAAERVPVEDAAGEIAGSPALQVRVVIKATQQPVAGARVFAIGSRTSLDGTRADEHDLPAQPEHRTDAEGNVAMPLLEPGMTVCCRHEAMWAEATVWAPPEDGAPVLLQLEPDHDLRVQVQGPDGRPLVGVPVTVAASERMHEGALLLGGNLVQDTAGADGIAVFEHLQARVQSRAIIALIDMPLPQRVQQALELAALPTSPVVLRLPATGSLALQLVDDRGPFAPDKPVALEMRVIGADAGKSQVHTYLLRRGALTLPAVALGLSLQTEVECDYCTGSQLVQGPTVAGEARQVELRIHRQPVLTGRLVDEARAPIANARWRAVYAAGSWTAYRVYFDTDADGRFSMPMPPVFAGDSELLAVIEPDGPGRLQARLELPYWILQRPADHDCGDLVAALPPVLVDGIVVDQHGEPVGGAHLRVQQHRDGTRETAVDTKAESGVDGAFAIRAHLWREGLHLIAEASMRRAFDQPFTPGTRGMRIVMPATGRIEVGLRLDADVPKRLLLASCIDAASGAVETKGVQVALHEGKLRFDDLTPGTAAVVLRTVGETEPVARIDAVAVEPGRTTTLPDIDLRGRLHTVVLRPVDAEGKAVLEAEARLDPDRQGVRENPVTHDGRLVLLLHRPVNVAVHSVDRGNAMVPALFADAEVVLAPASKLVLHVTGEPPPSPLRLQPVLELAGLPAAVDVAANDRQWRDSGDLYERHDGFAGHAVIGGAVDDHGDVAVAVPTAGTWRLRWRLEQGGAVRWIDGAPTEVRVDASMAARLEVSLSATALAAAARALR